jgi:23S rRNA (guanosine2251-2'-O)-methyltransferase
VDLNLPLALVVGNEGSGLRRLVRDLCDFRVRLPMYGRVQSLNAAVAGSLALFAARLARGGGGRPRKPTPG